MSSTGETSQVPKGEEDPKGQKVMTKEDVLEKCGFKKIRTVDTQHQDDQDLDGKNKAGENKDDNHQDDDQKENDQDDSGSSSSTDPDSGM